MAYHVFKGRHGQCKCLWCGARKLGSSECRVGDDIRVRVKQFASEHGRTWKAALRHLWNTSQDEGLLRQARNSIGPRQLDKISQHLLDRVTV
jgi:hypothetical protein